MVAIEDLPTDADGKADMSGLDPAKAKALLQSAILGLPDADVDKVVAKLAEANERYRRHSQQRRFLLEAIDGFGDLAELAARLGVKAIV